MFYLKEVLQADVVIFNFLHASWHILKDNLTRKLFPSAGPTLKSQYLPSNTVIDVCLDSVSVAMLVVSLTDDESLTT